MITSQADDQLLNQGPAESSQRSSEVERNCFTHANKNPVQKLRESYRDYSAFPKQLFIWRLFGNHLLACISALFALRWRTLPYASDRFWASLQAVCNTGTKQLQHVCTMLWFFTDPDLFFYSGEGAREKFLPVTAETDKTIWFQKKTKPTNSWNQAIGQRESLRNVHSKGLSYSFTSCRTAAVKGILRLFWAVTAPQQEFTLSLGTKEWRLHLHHVYSTEGHKAK